MNLAPQYIPTYLFAVSLLLDCILVIVAIRYAPWRAIVRATERQHALFFSLVFLPFFWLLHVKLQGVLEIHLLAVTSMILVFGWCIGTLAAALSVIIYTTLWTQTWWALPVNILVSVFIPGSVSFLIFFFISRWRVNHLFAYMLGAGFFGAIASVLVVGVIMSGIGFLTEGSELSRLIEHNRPYFFIWAFPEGFINGTIVSAITIFYPQLVKTLDEDRYLSD